LGREEGLAILEFGSRAFGGIWGRAFGFLKATGEGVKMFMPPVVGYGYFLESPKMA